ncbi:uncharacterized protein IWZ02DRAFT_437535 [Phyllosticta citriasiana]|uniref:uncharacterized protein n=1 Tax=Phyllosticta citriasiana TaxID=595635 RepID=UPI0030FDC81F
MSSGPSVASSSASPDLNSRRLQWLSVARKCLIGSSTLLGKLWAMCRTRPTQSKWSGQIMSTSTCVIMGPGVLTSVGQALKEPVGNVHFVGTETSDVWRGYMEGAVRSGIGGAEEVIEALQGQKKRSVASL